MIDLISRQATIEHLKKRLIETALNNTGVKALCDSIFADTADNRIEPWVNEVPSAQSEIIRCKDCKRMQEDKIFHQYWCNGNEVRPDHFCGYAERKDNGEV